MLKNRAIRLSLRDKISGMLTSPDSGAGWEKAWHVYTEADFRQAATDGTVVAGGAPVFPWVYLLDSFLQPIEGIDISIMQPQIVVEIDEYAGFPFELGNINGRKIKACIHVFGKNRAERDDLACYLMDYIGSSFQINSYTAAVPSGTKVEDALIDPASRIVEDIYTARSDVLMSNFILDWTRLTLSFKTQL